MDIQITSRSGNQLALVVKDGQRKVALTVHTDRGGNLSSDTIARTKKQYGFTLPDKIV